MLTEFNGNNVEEGCLSVRCWGSYSGLWERRCYKDWVY